MDFERQDKPRIDAKILREADGDCRHGESAVVECEATFKEVVVQESLVFIYSVHSAGTAD